jgi:formylmethanofuran dehydrogenase subunit A
MDKLLIRNGTLLTMSDDRQPRKADLLVVGGRIKKIDTVVDRNVKPDTIIDASGMVVPSAHRQPDVRTGPDIGHARYLSGGPQRHHHPV